MLLKSKDESISIIYQAQRQDSVTKKAQINFGGHEKFIHVNLRRARGARNLFECGSNEKGENQKKSLQYKSFPKV